MIHVKPNRVRYLLTPTGIAEKAKMSRESLQYSLRFYSEARTRVGARFAALASEWPENCCEKRIAFYGTGEIAEVGYVCLQETDLQLVAAAVDDRGRKRFFNVPVYRPEWLRQNSNPHSSFDRLVVMSFDNVHRIARELADLGVEADRICWL
jgi:hypothetical protein